MQKRIIKLLNNKSTDVRRKYNFNSGNNSNEDINIDHDMGI